MYKRQFDKYNVKYGENPEDIATKLYGDPTLHWVILMVNDITDRFYQWPMTQPQFQEYIEDKYGLANIDAVHHYEITQASGRSSGQGAGDYSHLVECNSDEDGATEISNRDYEQRIQDKNRQIRLLDKAYLGQFVEEFELFFRKFSVIMLAIETAFGIKLPFALIFLLHRSLFKSIKRFKNITIYLIGTGGWQYILDVHVDHKSLMSLYTRRHELNI